MHDRYYHLLKLNFSSKAANCPYAVTFITCGRHNEYNYMVMELLGDNISELRRSQPNVIEDFIPFFLFFFLLLYLTEFNHFRESFQC